MMSSQGGNAPTHYDTALAILAAAADPKGTAERIAALQEAETKAKQGLEAVRVANLQLQADTLAFQNASQEKIKNLDAREAEISRENEALSRRKSDFARDDAQLTMSRAKLDDDRKQFETLKNTAANEAARALADLEQRRINLGAKVNEVEAKRVTLDEREGKLAEAEAAYQEKLAELNKSLQKLRG